MAYNKAGFDAVHMYMSELTSRVVAKTGIPTDRFHLGKILMQCLQDDLYFLSQVDGATGESEITGSVLNRSIRCAIAFRKLGIEKGDVMIIMGPNHLDLGIPQYAALYLGVAIAATDSALGTNELKRTFSITRPKIILCQSEKTPDIEEALKLSNLESIIVTFDESSEYYTLAQLLKDTDDNEVKDFQCSDFDPEETPIYLTATSGTTGVPKIATLTQNNVATVLPYMWLMGTKFPSPTRMLILMSPIQWVTALLSYLLTPIMKITRLQASVKITPELFAEFVNNYKPTTMMGSPLLMRNMLTVKDKCDFSCFDYILLGGSLVAQELLDELKELTKSKYVYGVYGMSEIILGFHNTYSPPKGSSGTPLGVSQYRLVDQFTKEDITVANVPGELWVKGPNVFKGYYNNPEMTAEALTEDGWFKTGDIFYRDDFCHFYFLERLKCLLKYKGHQISPIEVEEVVRQHPGVLEVCVVGIPDSECGDLAVACVIPRPGTTPTAQELKDLVKESLAESKQLRGGVIFVKELPTTCSSKINRKKLQDMVLTMKRE